MEVLVLRILLAVDWTLSNFFFDNARMGVGVEDEKRDVKVKGETCVPEGIYELGLRTSPKFSYSYYRDNEGNLIAAKDRVSVELQKKYHTAHEMIWVKDVPGFDFILWHWGNTDEDTDGCYCVGRAFGKIKAPSGKIKDGVAESRKKYMEIYPILWKAIKKGKCTVEYRLESAIV